MWVNSLKIPNVNVNNLFEDIKDGIVLLKVLDRVEPGCVDWKKVELKPNHRLKKIHNANFAVEIGKHIKFTLVNVGGIDLVDGKKKLALALIWQMVRKHTLQLLGGWTEEKLLEWALEKVKKEPKITSFKDKSISNCQFLFNLLATIEPRAINWDLVTPGKI
jgi:plastin-1